MKRTLWRTIYFSLCYYYMVHGSRVISNVALNKPTTQSSTHESSSRAVDGFPSTCMSTSGTGSQWWQIDLGSVYTIANLSIHNDKPNGLKNITVELSDTNSSNVSGGLLYTSPCYSLTESQDPVDHIISLSCPHDRVGRYVRISKIVQSLDDPLTLCEVVIEVSRDECNLADIALNKPAHQSSTHSDLVAGKAVDGDLNPDINTDRACSHTLPLDNNPWWQVDFGGVYIITHVSIQNRICHGDRLKDFTVEISETNATEPNGHLKNGKLCYNYTEAHVPSGELRTLACPTDTIGRYLRIAKLPAILTLCEVIVEGKPVSCLDTTCQKMPTIRQRDDQSLTEIVKDLKKLMPGNGSRCNFKRKWIGGGWYWSVWFPTY